MSDVHPRKMIEQAKQMAEHSFHTNSRYAESIDIARTACQAACESQEPLLIADSVDTLGNAVYYQVTNTSEGNLSEALACFQQALELYWVNDQPCGIAKSLFHIGMVYVRERKYTEARVAFEEARPIAETHNCQPELAEIVRHIGFAKLSENDVAGAVACFQQSLAIRESLGNQVLILYAHIPLGNIVLKQGDLTQATFHFHTACRIAQELKLPLPLVFAWYSVGELNETQSKIIDAKDAYMKALTYAEKADYKSGIALCCSKLNNLTD